MLGSFIFHYVAALMGIEISDRTSSVSACPWLSGPCKAEWISYRVYDRNQSLGQYVEVTDSWNNLSSAGYTPGIPTVVIIHGFNDNMHLYSLVNIKNELLKTYDMMVIFMDWAKVVPEGCYVASVYNVRYAGNCLAYLIDAMGRPQSDLHIIGFSLGAHVPASAAKVLNPYKIPRITGLDPALPFVFGQRRLSKDDAKFVDIIHTNAFIQGQFLQQGNVDFFVNGGIFQPGCGSSIKDKVECSHLRAPVYYAESINTKVGFWGCESSYLLILESCRPKDVIHLMGYHVNTTFYGIVKLKTASTSPFALGKPEVNN